MNSKMSRKDTLMECLEGTLSPDGQIRNSSEKRLQALEVTDDYGLLLLEIVLNANLPPPIRQLACVLLRKYVELHWSCFSEKFIHPVVPQNVKQTIREMTPIGLSATQSKIRNSFAALISSIAHWDWPDDWPNLFDMLLQLIKDPNTVKGAMRVMAEVAKEFSDQDVVKVAPLIFADMSKILTEKDTFSIETRAKSVQIFRTCVSTLLTVCDFDKKTMTNILSPVVSTYMGIFVGILCDTDAGTNMLKKDIIKSISTLLQSCFKLISPFLHHVLPPAWAILTSNTAEYKKVCEGIEENTDSDVDSDGEDCGMEAVLFSIFDLVQALIDSDHSASRKIIREGLEDLIYYSIFYMQIKQEKIEAWSIDPSLFASDEEEESMTYTLRVCANDLLTNAYSSFPEKSIKALGQAFSRHFSENPNDWRLQEACLYAVSTLGLRVVHTSKNVSNPEEAFDIHGFVQNVVVPGLSSDYILLVGRCLVLASNFCNVIDPALTENFLKASVECLNSEKPIVLKILAVRSLITFIFQSKENIHLRNHLLLLLPQTIDALVELGSTQSVEILSCVLQCLVDILSMDEKLTATLAPKAITLAIATFQKFNSDPIISPLIEDVVHCLCKSVECVEALQQRVVAVLISVLTSDANGDIGGTQACALDLLVVIIRGSPLPLGDILMNNAFPAVLECISKSDDNAILQNGGECLRAYLSVAPLQVVAYRDHTGCSGLGHIVQTACRLLEPSSSEFSANFVGKLVTTLILKTGEHLGEQLDHLLRAVLSKLQSADSLSVVQSLCLVFANLFNHQMEAALNFLDSVPGPTGESALNFVMSKWVCRQQTFFGMYERKTSCVALSKLLLHGVTTKDPRLAQINVDGERIIELNTGVVTRSRSKPEKWTVIPLLVKIFKLLIQESGLASKRGLGSADDNSSETDSDGSEDDPFGDEKDDRKDVCVGDNLHYEYEDEPNGQFNDPDVLSDPIFKMDIDAYIKDFLMGFSSQSFYPEFAAHLNEDEEYVMKQLPTVCESLPEF